MNNNNNFLTSFIAQSSPLVVVVVVVVVVIIVVVLAFLPAWCVYFALLCMLSNSLLLPFNSADVRKEANRKRGKKIRLEKWEGN